MELQQTYQQAGAFLTKAANMLQGIMIEVGKVVVQGIMDEEQPTTYKKELVQQKQQQIAVPPRAQCPIEEIRMPWKAETEAEKPYERVFEEQIRKISERPESFLDEVAEADQIALTPQVSVTAGAVLQVDNALRQLRFTLVPKYLTEEQFWQRYFRIVARVKDHVMHTEVVEYDECVFIPPCPEAARTEEL